MRRFYTRALREISLGLALGGLAALGVRAALGQSLWKFLRGWLGSLTARLGGAPEYKALLIAVVIGTVLLVWRPTAELLARLARSWRAGILTGIGPVWAALTFLYFTGNASWTAPRFFIFASVGLLVVIAAGSVISTRQVGSDRFTLDIPVEPHPIAGISADREIAFDLPIKDWNRDRLGRGPFVRGLAEAIIRQRAPVVGVVGPLGEGKSSILNLLRASLRNQRDVLVVTFSSWLPGDEQALALSLFSTIAEAVNSRYVAISLTREFKRFASLLAGVTPRIGGVLKGFAEHTSQVEQIRSLETLLSRLPIRIVVLIDEVDRMDAKELSVLLKAIRGVDNLPNLTYVCAFDRNSLIRLEAIAQPSVRRS
jgi:hypothetical protein